MGLGVVTIRDKGGQEPPANTRGAKWLLNGDVDGDQKDKVRHGLDQGQSQWRVNHLEKKPKNTVESKDLQKKKKSWTDHSVFQTETWSLR